eukprot:TRINITY_DN178_c0_g1_i1.p1 TRINITY_DN178_c0_g1~~TRINITY_DN178_c0_g1_i1.p1  ORF type:complete len:374 (+),score=74.67 TRINITY_DN178_c0_g1_i1:59-1180(+)
MEYGLGNEGLTASLRKVLAQNEANQRASLGALQLMDGPGLDASLQNLLTQTEAKQRALLDALQHMDGSGASHQWRANSHYQQQAFPARIEPPMQHHTLEQRRLENARRALQAAIINWHACYQEVQLGQPMVPGSAPVNSQMVDQLARITSQAPFPVALPPGLAPPEANTPPTPSPPSSSGSSYVNEAAHPWYVPVTGQFLDKVEIAQHEQQRMPPTSFAAKHNRTPEDVCDAAGEETLRTHLQALLKFEAGCILIVRKINRLGFDSARILKEHFSLCGKVLEVYVAHSRIKPISGKQSQARWRPSGLGFVVMSCAEEVAAILKLGADQEIHGCAIRVFKFERRAAMESDKNAEKGMPGLCEENETPESRLVGA